MYRIGNKYICYGMSIFLISLLLMSITTIVNAEPDSNHSNNGDKKCIDCHSDTHTNFKNIDNRLITKQQKNIISEKDIQVVPKTPTNVIGNINLISSVGQNWYQQGIYGPTSSSVPDQSWGWTFFDENPPSEFIVPYEDMTQRNNIYALLLDDGNNSNPISGAQVTANVTYWTYNNVSYTSNITTVQLNEDPDRRGFYSGRFDFYGGTSYTDGSGGMTGWYCDGCHPSYGSGTIDTQKGYFPGNYTMSIRAEADGKTKIIDTSFEVTPWGCENCHGSGNQHKNGDVDMDSACYMCHGINQIVGDGKDAGNPHQNVAHRNINCADCHTDREINSQTFSGVTFNNGGINNGPIPQYNSQQISLNGGKHSSLSCTDCHGDLLLPNIGGGYNPNGYVINGKVNKNRSFAGIQQLQDYYTIDVTGGGPLNIQFDWTDSVSSNLGFYLYTPNFNPRNKTYPYNPDEGDVPYYNGATSSNKPESYTNSAPMIGKWILNPYGYNLNDQGYTWYATLQSPINYTITSTYPIEKKGLPSIPECNSCHNSTTTGGAYTKHEIPDWNPGFAHVDTDRDGDLDIQCRMCHNTLHDIDTKTCQNCHTSAPTGHFIQEPDFSQYTVSQCLQCHGDPHKVTGGGGGSCMSCHTGEGDKNDVNISKFGRHANINTSEGLGIVSDADCTTCHYNRDMNKSKIYLCDSCHTDSNGVVSVTDPALLVPILSHNGLACKNCHAPIKYHMDGTVGPKGFMDLFSFG